MADKWDAFEVKDQVEDKWSAFETSKDKREGSILPSIGQLVGNIGGGFVGSKVGHPYLGSAIGGVAGRAFGHLEEQKLSNPVTSLMPPIIGEALTPLFSKLSPEKQKQMNEDMAGTVMLQTALAPLGYGVGKTLQYGSKVLDNLPKALKSEVGSKFAEKIRGAFYSVKKNAVDKFGSRLDQLAINNPTKSVSLRGVVDGLKSNWDELNPTAQSAIRKTPILKELIDKPELANNIKLADAQKIINFLNTKIPKNIRANNLDILDVTSDVRAAQLDAFPEMASIRADYQKVIEPWNNVKNFFKFNKVLASIEKGFGGAEGKQAIEQILPKDVIKQMGGYKAAKDAIIGLRKVAPYLIGGAAGVAGYGVARSVIRPESISE
jgi:hypothetical protein